MSSKIAVIGEEAAVAPFGLVGLEVFPADQAEVASQILDDLAKAGYGLVYLTETLAQDMGETLARYDRLLTPTITLIPSNKGTLGIAQGRLLANRQKALGRQL